VEDLKPAAFTARKMLNPSMEFTPIELNPLRFGGAGLCELAYHAFGVDPYRAFAQDRAPDWPALWRDRGDKVYAYYLGYNGTGVDVARQRPHTRAFYSLFTRVLSDAVLDYRAQPAFAVAYIEDENVARIHDLLQVEFADFFVHAGAYSAASRQALRRHGMEARIAAGTTLWRQGERGDDVLLVLQGQLEVVVATVGEGEVVVDVVAAGGVVGELAALDGAARSAGVRARSTCTLLRIPGPTFRALLRCTPDLMEDLYWQQVDRVGRLSRMVAGNDSEPAHRV